MDYEYETKWDSSKRCGYISYSEYSEGNEFDETLDKYWMHHIAKTDGNFSVIRDSSEQRCNCSLKYGPFRYRNAWYDKSSNIYVAVCGWNDMSRPTQANSWMQSNTCPKGWGVSWCKSTTENYVQHAQGCTVAGSPIYGYVTRYRDAYYDYITSRVAKI